MSEEQQEQQQQQERQEKPQQQQQGFDPEAMRSMMQETIRTELASRQQQQQEDADGSQDFGQDYQQHQQHQTQQQQEIDPVARVIAPVVGPALENVMLQAQAASDAASFYTPTLGEDAVDTELRGKWRGDIEKKFGELMRMKRPTPRADIFAWYKGQRINDVVDAHVKARAAAEQRAALAETAGPGSTRTLTGGKAPHELTEEEMVKALEKGF